MGPKSVTSYLNGPLEVCYEQRLDANAIHSYPHELLLLPSPRSHMHLAIRSEAYFGSRHAPTLGAHDHVHFDIHTPSTWSHVSLSGSLERTGYNSVTTDQRGADRLHASARRAPWRSATQSTRHPTSTKVEGEIKKIFSFSFISFNSKFYYLFLILILF